MKVYSTAASAQKAVDRVDAIYRYAATLQPGTMVEFSGSRSNQYYEREVVSVRLVDREDHFHTEFYYREGFVKYPSKYDKLPWSEGYELRRAHEKEHGYPRDNMIKIFGKVEPVYITSRNVQRGVPTSIYAENDAKTLSYVKVRDLWVPIKDIIEDMDK